MASSHKKRQTMAKFTRERMVAEKRARKQEKREEKKAAAALLRSEENGTQTGVPEDPQPVELTG